MSSSFILCLLLVQLPSQIQLFVTPRTATRQSFPTLTISRRLPKFMCIALGMPPSHLILRRPMFLLPSIFPSIRNFSNESAVCIRWPKYWRFSISPTKNSGLISLKIDWFDLHAVQGTFRSLLQHHSSKALILWHSALFTVQLSQLHEPTGKPTAVTLWTFVSSATSLLFFFSFIFISWRLITLQHCSGFCHTLKWISHGFTCIPHPSPPSYTLRKPDLKEIRAPQCSSQHCL